MAWSPNMNNQIRRSQVIPPQPLSSTSRTRNLSGHMLLYLQHINLDTVPERVRLPPAQPDPLAESIQHNMPRRARGTKFCNQHTGDGFTVAWQDRSP